MACLNSGRPLPSEGRGHRFESCRVRQAIVENIEEFSGPSREHVRNVRERALNESMSVGEKWGNEIMRNPIAFRCDREVSYPLRRLRAFFGPRFASQSRFSFGKWFITVCRATPQASAVSFTDFFRRSMSSALSRSIRSSAPNRTPRSLARFTPARVRSTINCRSNSAKAPIRSALRQPQLKASRVRA